jgi:uridine kinase
LTGHPSSGRPSAHPSARVIVVAGPSGSGKSRLSRRLGLPVLRLDDFYKDGNDPSLPRIIDGPNAGLVDWDDPASWLGDEAMAAIEALCTSGIAEVPVYDIAHDGRTGVQILALDGHPAFVAEGIFAQEIVAACRQRGHLLAAYCLRQPPVLTFWRRLVRDLRERRKPPLVLLRRGLALMRQQHQVVAACAAAGCRVAGSEEAYRELRASLRPRTATLPAGLRQPDEYSCGATSVVVARMLRDPAYADEVRPRFGAAVQETHRGFHGWPRRLGTAFWSVAHHLHEIEGVRYTLGIGYFAPGRAFDRLRAAADRGLLSGLYVGTWLLPRHVTLVIGCEDEALLVFDPADGALRRVTREQFVARRLGLGGWPRVWSMVVPRA